jgi:hypothetical protein
MPGSDQLLVRLASSALDASGEIIQAYADEYRRPPC